MPCSFVFLIALFFRLFVFVLGTGAMQYAPLGVYIILSGGGGGGSDTTAARGSAQVIAHATMLLRLQWGHAEPNMVSAAPDVVLVGVVCCVAVK